MEGWFYVEKFRGMITFYYSAGKKGGLLCEWIVFCGTTRPSQQSCLN